MIVQLPRKQWNRSGFGQREVVVLPGGWWEKKETSGLYVPSNPKSLLGADGCWHAMTGKPLPSLGALDISGAPPGSWSPGASSEEYAHGISMAVGSITPDVRGQIAATNPMLGVAIDGMGAIIESVTGNKPGLPIAIDVAVVVADVMSNLLLGKAAIDAIIDVTVEAIAQAIGASVSAAAEAIPFVGGFVRSVLSIIEAMSRPRISPEQRKELDQKYQSYCRSFVTNWNNPNDPSAPRGTDEYNQVSMADLFAQNDARAQMWRMIAGGGSRNERVRSAYNRWIDGARKKYGITGIPVHVMRQMNEMMDGVFAARRDPNRAAGGQIFTDNGRAAGGILLHVTRDQMVAGAFNAASCQSLADNFVAPEKTICIQPSGHAGQVCDDYPPCGQHRLGVRLGDAFWDFIYGYDSAIMDPHSDAYIDAEEAAKEAQSSGNNFTFTTEMAAKLAGQVQATMSVAGEAAAIAEKQRKAVVTTKKISSAKAAAMSSAVLLGGGGFLMARRAAKKRGR